MASEEDLRRLAASRGRAFDRLFLRLMIRHHEGALTMVDDLNGIPRAGMEAEVASFARHVEADQRIEIGRMNALLTALTS